MIRIFGLWLLTLACVTALALSPPAQAQDCQTIDDVRSMLEATGDRIVAIVGVNGETFNQIVIAEKGGQIVHGEFLDGCSVNSPVPIGPARVKPELDGTPA